MGAPNTQVLLDSRDAGKGVASGHPHPLAIVIREAVEVFAEMGFAVADGPIVETEYYNFDALNIPKDHPARDAWDTFWLKPVASSDRSAQLDAVSASGLGLKTQTSNDSPCQSASSPQMSALLRTHTSPVQIRYMESHQPPIRIIAPGRTYRYEATDATHEAQFFQLEGLMVDRDVSVAHLKAVLEKFFSAMFKKESTIRMRPSYFPFVEPGFEVDVSCFKCVRKGCNICKQSGWIEILGAGMVQQSVLANVGISPREYRGFAFGCGVDRIAMLRYGVTDVRAFHNGDLRVVTQF